MGKPQLIQNIRIAVSYYCNLKCKHCYVPENERLDYKQLEKDQLSVEEINNFIDYLISSFGLKKVTLTGGECLLNHVWSRTKPVLQHSLDQGMDIQINTSGSGEIEMSELKKVAKDKYTKILLHVSLDGINHKKVDSFRGKTGAMDRAIKTMKDAVSLGFNVQARYTATKTNLDEAQACYQMLEEMGVQSFMIKPMLPAGNAEINSSMILSKEEVKELQKKLLIQSINNRTQLDLPSPVYVDMTEYPSGANVKITLCICGFEAGYIAFNGDVLPCTYIVGSQVCKKYILGNIRTPNFDFKEIWLHPDTYYEYRHADPGACTTHNILYSSIEKKDMLYRPGFCIF